MKFVLYLPYYDYGNTSDKLDDYYKDENSYIEAMRKEYESTKDSVFDAVANNFGGLTVKDDKAIGLYQAIPSKTSENVVYAPCECELIGEDGISEDGNTMTSHMVSGDLFIIEAVLDYDTIHEDFEGELNDWCNVNDKITSYAANAGEEWLLQNAPKKDVKMSFVNKSKDTVYMELKNCQILERSERNKIVFLVERVEMTTPF